MIIIQSWIHFPPLNTPISLHTIHLIPLSTHKTFTIPQAYLERWACLLTRRELHNTSQVFRVTTTPTHLQKSQIVMATQQQDRAVSQWSGQEPLQEDDPQIMELIRKEKERQRVGLELIASEVSWISDLWGIPSYSRLCNSVDRK